MVARVIFSAHTKQPPEKCITISMYDVYTLYVYKNLRPLMSLNICIDFSSLSLSRCLCVCACVSIQMCVMRWCVRAWGRSHVIHSNGQRVRERGENKATSHPFRVTCKEVRVRSRRPFFPFSFSYVRRRRSELAARRQSRRTRDILLYSVFIHTIG